uniref:SFRICE_031932 n=1 Tax=Spodoptera frugiperda TaxID=7108 RepID=A0A2H1WLL9_SPOFR
MEKNEQETPSLLFSKNVFYNISDTLFDHLPIVYICRNNVTTIRRQNYGTIKPICKEYKLKKRVVSTFKHSAHICTLTILKAEGRGFDPFDPRLLLIKLDVVLSLNGLEVSPLSHCIQQR